MPGASFTFGKGCCATSMEVDEGILQQENKTIIFTKFMSEVILINDSSSEEIGFKFSESSEFATLKPKETIPVCIKIQTVYLCSTAVAEYRIWGVG